MNSIKIEKTEIIEVMEREADTESPPLSEDSESCYEPHLKQTDLTEVSKRHWMYSAALNKVYIDMNRVLPIQFQWQFDEIEALGIKKLQIRALPIFANPEFQQLSIKRCPIHIIQDKLSDSKKNEHIIWCEQGDAIYEEDPNSQRYSVVATVHNYLPYSDYKSYNLLYKFMCKSSCSMSLNRRPIYVIFTLETLNGQVLGRKKLGVKVCSCPRRDMLKEEEIKKKKLATVNVTKKRKIFVSDSNTPKKLTNTSHDNDEDKIYELPILKVQGKQLYLSTLELLHGHFLGNAVRDNRLIDSHPLISKIADLISQVKSENKNHKDNTDSENQLRSNKINLIK